MQPVNPFLRAFFRSALPSQCQPISHHVLLVPTTDVLVHSKDAETGTLLADLAGTEDFLASHVLRVAGGIAPGIKEGTGGRDGKSKARQYMTINARTVVIKDTFVYSNKGFRALTHAQLLSDTIYHPDTPDNQQWLVYYISSPLIGTVEVCRIQPAILTTRQERERLMQNSESAATPVLQSGSSNGPLATRNPHKKDVKTFSGLLTDFPLIAKHMQPDLEKVFNEFTERFNKPVAKKASRPPSVRSQASTTSLRDSLATLKSSISNDSATLRHTSSFTLDAEEGEMREALEGVVTAAIDLFQGVDKQQLSMLASMTNLSGPAAERLIERYVAEQLHEICLFPQLCRIKRDEDADLESRIRKMHNVDIAQVGIPIEGGCPGKRALALRLDSAIATFKKQGVASNPQDMIDTLLATAKILATGSDEEATNENETEKQALAMTMNADTLVSMLLIVIIRSGVRHLHARLSYMRHFVFIDDVETGETGYVLSTLEAVLLYLARDSDPLRRASRRNHQLWQAAKDGNLTLLQSLMEPFGRVVSEPQHMNHHETNSTDDNKENQPRISTDEQSTSSRPSTSSTSRVSFAAVEGSLEHVFPFQRPPTPPPEVGRPKKKRVSLAAVRSHSESSIRSSRTHSRTASNSSMLSGASGGISADTSLETLAQTRNAQGDSLLMMAVEGDQVETLKYLLILEEHYTVDFVLDDRNNEGTTLLCAATQNGNQELSDILLGYFKDHTVPEERLRQYWAVQDSKGRCAAHYLFNHPKLLKQNGFILPWKLKDKNGQTPLFALCRSYDHPQYRQMVSLAAFAFASAGPDHGRLEVDDHVDQKGNTLLHIVNDPELTKDLLKYSNVDVNALNDRHFTPLMVASKYGKTGQVMALMVDPRVEVSVRDSRGLSAAELAKDDKTRNEVDDLVLFNMHHEFDHRVTAIVRSHFVEDATIRVVLKSGVFQRDGRLSVTTSRRSLADFENLARCLSMEQPASWLPTQFNMISPFLIPSKPSRRVLKDIELRLSNFLQNLLTHPTFSQHEMVWEFCLVPDIDPALLAERSKRKAEIRIDKLRDEYVALTDTTEIEVFVGHAYEQVRKLSSATRALIRRVNRQRQLQSDLHDLQDFASVDLRTITFLPNQHKTAFERFTKTLRPIDVHPMTELYYAVTSIMSSTQALLVALHRPTNLIGSMDSARQTLERALSSLNRQSRWTPKIGFFDETHRAIADEAREKAEKTTRELEVLGCELRYTQQTVAAELAGWQENHFKEGRKMLKSLARNMVIREKDRLERMRMAMRELRK